LKIKIFNGLLIVDILTALLILTIIFIPSGILRIVLGIPFLLFFPGYAVVSALFINKEDMDKLESVAISMAMSIALVALIGFGLNYTSWGIRLEPVLYSTAALIAAMSIIAFIRRSISSKGIKLTGEFNLALPVRSLSPFNKYLSLTLVIFILGALGMLGYTISENKAAERFTEFYMLGFYGKAQDYPLEFVMANRQITYIRYGNNTYDITNPWGKVTLGIVNHEQQIVTYSVKIKVDNELVDTDSAGKIELKPGEKWEQEIKFTPQHTGDNQKLEFLLFKDSDPTVESLQLWINVKAAE
jgi:uncharacterized membrane protein